MRYFYVSDGGWYSRIVPARNWRDAVRTFLEENEWLKPSEVESVREMSREEVQEEVKRGEDRAQQA